MVLGRYWSVYNRQVYRDFCLGRESEAREGVSVFSCVVLWLRRCRLVSLICSRVVVRAQLTSLQSFSIRFLSTTASSTSPPHHSSTTHVANKSLPAIAFDIDGVLLRGKSLLPTARQALRKVTSIADGGIHPSGIPHVYLTNGGGVTEEVKAKQLSQLFDIHIRPESIILSHTPMQDLLPQFRDQLILTLGMTNVRAVAQSYGFKHVLIPEDLMAKHPSLVPHFNEAKSPRAKEPAITNYDNELETIAAIFVMHDPNEWYRDLQLSLDLLTLPRKNGQPFPAIYFSNPDFVFSGKAEHPRLAQGAFRVCLQALYKEYTGKPLPLTLYGKPHAITYRYAEKVLQAQAKAMGVTISHTYGIGDNPKSDIKGANSAGSHWSSIFVQSGTIPRSSITDELPHFDHICVDSAVDFILAGGAHDRKTLKNA